MQHIENLKSPFNYSNKTIYTMFNQDLVMSYIYWIIMEVFLRSSPHFWLTNMICISHRWGTIFVDFTDFPQMQWEGCLWRNRTCFIPFSARAMSLLDLSWECSYCDCISFLYSLLQFNVWNCFYSVVNNVYERNKAYSIPSWTKCSTVFSIYQSHGRRR